MQKSGLAKLFMKITLFSTFNMADWNLFKNWKRVLCCVVLVNYLVSRCLVSSECVAEAQYCCWFSFGWAWQCVTQRKFNSTIRGNICTRATNTHTHTSIVCYYEPEPTRENQKIYCSTLTLMGSYSIVKETIFFSVNFYL